MADVMGCEQCDGETLCSYCGTPPGVARPPERARAGGVELRFLAEGGGESTTVDDGERVEIGRMSTDKAIQRALCPYDDVGRLHFALTPRGDRVEVVDLRSRNGTYVGDTRVSSDGPEEFPLPVTFRLGQDCVVRVERRG